MARHGQQARRAAIVAMARAHRHFDQDYEETVALSDGTEVELRLVRPQDKELLVEGFQRLSAESRFRRFFASKSELSDKEVRYLTEVDGENHFALGARRRLPDGCEQGVGVARFVRLSDRPDIAEPAIVVVDDMQGKGLGHALLVRLNAAARERGVERFRCQVLGDNPSMLAIIREADPTAIKGWEGDAVRVDCEIPRRPLDPEARQRPRGKALHHLLGLGAQGALRLRRAIAWWDELG